MKKLACTPAMKLENDCYDWHARHAEKCAEAARRSHDIMMIGDSITHFWETSYPESWQAFTAGRDVWNLGFGWDRTCNVLYRIRYGELDGQAPRAIVLNIGTNNFSATDHYPGDDPEGTGEGVAAVVETLRKFVPEALLVVMCPFQRGTGAEPHRAWLRELAIHLHRRYDGREADGIHLLDISEQYLRADCEIDPTLFRGDNCHPNEAGYALWSAALLPLFSSLGL